MSGDEGGTLRAAVPDFAPGIRTSTESIEVISKPIFGVILNQPKELKLGKNHPPFLKGGRGD
jgi:hypothetical protein